MLSMTAAGKAFKSALLLPIQMTSFIGAEYAGLRITMQVNEWKFNPALFARLADGDGPAPIVLNRRFACIALKRGEKTDAAILRETCRG